MRIVIGNDHAATEMKFRIMEYIKELGHEVINCGTDEQVSCDYPEYAELAAGEIQSGNADCGILICGTGIGISLAANKVKGIRAGVCSDTVSARLMKEHNNANMLCFGARIVGIELAKEIVRTYLASEFKAERHGRRVSMIHDIEEGHGTAGDQ